MRNIFGKQRIRFLILAAILIVTICAGSVWHAQEQKKTPSLRLAWGSQGSGPGQFYNPWGVAVDSSGNVYVVDSGNNRVVEFTGDGKYITQLGNSTIPSGVAVDSSGGIYVTDSGNNRVQKFGTFATISADQVILIIAIVAGVLAFLILRYPKNLRRMIMPATCFCV